MDLKVNGRLIIDSAGKTKITGVIDADKFTGRQVSGSEPYTDVVLHVRDGKKIKIINLSLKGEKNL